MEPVIEQITIRHSEKKDIQAIQALFTDSSVYSETLQLPFPSLAMWEARMETRPPGFYSLVAEVDGEVVGNIGLHVEQNPRRQHEVTHSPQYAGLYCYPLSASIQQLTLSLSLSVHRAPTSGAISPQPLSERL